MFLFERNALVTISPQIDKTPEGVTQFRWGTHVSLPYPFPSQKCVKREVEIADRKFQFSIHNHLDRIFAAPKAAPGMPRVYLHDRNKQLAAPTDDHAVSREYLQSVAIFEETTDYTSANDAFADAANKIQKCFDHLTDFLARCQTSSPYLTAWLVYPISLFDVGTVYHGVQCLCPHTTTWQVCASAPAISLARRLQHPLFFLDLPEDGPNETSDSLLIQASNELLAEAQMSLFRGMPRLTILNSYGAAESLANAVFKKKKTELLLANNVPPQLAETLVEEERQRHKTEPRFLFHRGLKSTCNRSLYDEDKQKYDDLVALQSTRHCVAHTGYRPSTEEARSAHKLACECAQWLADVGGLPTKALLPQQEVQVPGFSTVASDAHAVTAGEFEFLRKAMGFVTPADESSG